jgi:hypothetical protein
VTRVQIANVDVLSDLGVRRQRFAAKDDLLQEALRVAWVKGGNPVTEARARRKPRLRCLEPKPVAM